MRYEDWTFPEAEVRLGEHRELRQVLQLSSVPDHTTLYRFLQRLDDQVIDRAVGETVRRLRGTPKEKRRRACVGVDEPSAPSSPDGDCSGHKLLASSVEGAYRMRELGVQIENSD